MQKKDKPKKKANVKPKNEQAKPKSKKKAFVKQKEEKEKPKKKVSVKQKKGEPNPKKTMITIFYYLTVPLTTPVLQYRGSKER